MYSEFTITRVFLYLHVHVGHPSLLSVNTSSLGNNSNSPGQPSLASQGVVDEQGKKREIRLMKNRCENMTLVIKACASILSVEKY